MLIKRTCVDLHGTCGAEFLRNKYMVVQEWNLNIIDGKVQFPSELANIEYDNIGKFRLSITFHVTDDKYRLFYKRDTPDAEYYYTELGSTAPESTILAIDDQSAIFEKIEGLSDCCWVMISYIVNEPIEEIGQENGFA